MNTLLQEIGDNKRLKEIIENCGIEDRESALKYAIYILDFEENASDITEYLERTRI